MNQDQNTKLRILLWIVAFHFKKNFTLSIVKEQNSLIDKQELRNQIDTECQLYLCKPGLTKEEKSKALQTQQTMVDNVDRFQKQCLDNLRSNPGVELKLSTCYCYYY